MPELRAQDPGLNGIEPTVVALDVVKVLCRLAVVAEQPTLACELRVVGRDGPRLAACAEVLAGIEAEGGSVTERSRRPPAILALRIVFGAMRLARVFDDLHAVPLRLLEDLHHSAADELAGVERRLEDRSEFIAQLAVGRGEI